MRQSSSVWVDLFVVHGCMSRLDWQLAASPTSIDESGTDYLYRVDTFPDHDIIGRVDTIAPASGMEFSLLPPDNATGNFTKIVQRIPVKIVFPLDGALAGRVRPGMSVETSIDTRMRAPEQIQGE
jgi:membrane fusion protein, multidrug efflux system